MHIGSLMVHMSEMAFPMFMDGRWQCLSLESLQLDLSLLLSLPTIEMKRQASPGRHLSISQHTLLFWTCSFTHIIDLCMKSIFSGDCIDYTIRQSILLRAYVKQGEKWQTSANRLFITCSNLGAYADAVQEWGDILIIPLLAYLVVPLNFSTWYLTTGYLLYTEAGMSGFSVISLGCCANLYPSSWSLRNPSVVSLLLSHLQSRTHTD